MLAAAAQEDHRSGRAWHGRLIGEVQRLDMRVLRDPPTLLAAARTTTLAAVSETATGTRRWICESCGFIYDPEEGDPDGGIAPGTAFEDIPDDWFCPVCGARKRDFTPYEG
jgi:rubredoxin